MRVIGLTGGMGAGKSTVAALLAARGAHLIDADAIAREVVEPGHPALAAILERFGSGVGTLAEGLDRAALAAIVFADEDELLALEAITHPAIRDTIERRLAQHMAAERAEDRERVVVLDHPLLVETGMADDLDVVVVVAADVERRIERLALTRGVAPADARARIAAQADDATRASAATHLLRNDGDEAALATQVDELWQELTA